MLAAKYLDGDAPWLYILFYKFNDIIHRGAGLENGGDALLFECGNILVGDDAADEHENIVHLVLLREFHYARNDGVVRAGEDGESDDIHVFLQGCVDDHVGSLTKACVDDFHASVAESAGDDLGAAIVSVETGLCD